jgi:hypothetical protein
MPGSLVQVGSSRTLAILRAFVAGETAGAGGGAGRSGAAVSPVVTSWCVEGAPTLLAIADHCGIMPR